MGVEQDRVIAEFLGWTDFEATCPAVPIPHGLPPGVEPAIGNWKPCPAYSTEDDAALEGLFRLREKGWNFRVDGNTHSPLVDVEIWRVIGGSRPYPTMRAKRDSLAAAFAAAVTEECVDRYGKAACRRYRIKPTLKEAMK